MSVLANIPHLTSNEALAAALRQAAEAKNVQNVDVAYWCDGRELRASYDERNASGVDPNVTGYRGRVGCIAKYLTATLVAHACAEGRVRVTDDLAAVFSTCEGLAPYRERLACLRIMDLLHHSHGLDDTDIAELPLKADGRICLESMCARLLSKPPLAPVGRYFNYGSAGSRLIAAVLEHIYDATFADLLQRTLLQPLGIEVHSDSDFVCPANGSDLRMDASHLLTLARHHLSASNGGAFTSKVVSETLNDFRHRHFTPGGWQPLMRRVCLGVNEFGDGWYGHNSQYMGDSAVIRFNPELNAAISVTCSLEEGAHAILGTLFAQSLPEFSAKQTLKFLSAEQWAKEKPDTYIGTYENAALSITVDVAANKSLRVRVYQKKELQAGNREPYIKRYLRPAADGVFFSNPPEPQVVPYVQFLGGSDRAGDELAYMLNGRQIFARTSVTNN